MIKAVVWPYLNYCIQFWVPKYKGTKLIKSTRRAVKAAGGQQGNHEPEMCPCGQEGLWCI